jgi:hypothetical protein
MNRPWIFLYNVLKVVFKLAGSFGLAGSIHLVI